jgi:hypothetical protein
MRQVTIAELQVLINGKISDLTATRFSKFDADKIDRLTNDIAHYLVEMNNLSKV